MIVNKVSETFLFVNGSTEVLQKVIAFATIHHTVYAFPEFTSKVKVTFWQFQVTFLKQLVTCPGFAIHLLDCISFKLKRP